MPKGFHQLEAFFTLAQSFSLMENLSCLNCATPVSEKFCGNCGQRADTHRITFRHFVMHDLLHGVWHIERGIFFTLKEAMLRPGQAALDYIAGKRIRYYNVFYLCLILLGLTAIIIHYYQPAKITNSESATEILNFLENNVKFIVLGIVPVFAFNSWILFRKLRLNLAEHFIIAGMCLLGTMFCIVFYNLMKLVTRADLVVQFFRILQTMALFMAFLFPIWNYYNATKEQYKLGGFAWRMIVFYLMIIAEIIIFSLIAIYFVTSGSELIIN